MFCLRRLVLAPVLMGLLWLIACSTSVAWAQSSAQVRTPQVLATLLAHAPQGVVARPLDDAPATPAGGLLAPQAPLGGFTLPGTAPAPHRDTASASAPSAPLPTFEVWLGLHFKHSPDWHTYWQNPGDSGLPTELTWSLPAGVSAEPIQWPAPQKIFIGDMANYGYENEVLLPVRLRFSPEFVPAAGQQTLTVGLLANWLICHNECIPQSGQFQLALPLYSSTALDGELFQTAWAQHPQTLTLDTSSHARLSEDHTRLLLQVSGLPTDWQGLPLLWLPETADVLVNGSRPVPTTQNPLTERDWTQHWQGAVWHASLPVSPFRGASPAELTLLLQPEGQPTHTAERLVLPVQGTWPALNAPAPLSPALQAALDANAAKAQASATPPTPIAPSSTAFNGWLLALGGALLGGLLLNLMPCVFPVLAIKLLAFAQPTSPAHQRSQALGYCAGVLLSCLALGGLMLALRAMGEQLGWGFQLQSPLLVAALAALFTGIALNLFGLLQLPAGLTSHLPSQLRHPVLDSVYAGVLAVVVASPCTAPFMGASVGLAIGLPAWQALGIFAALGVGMSLPVLLIWLRPQLTQRLPRSGRWMNTLRQLLAFPMLATVVWLLWVLGQQVGVNGMAAWLTTLLVLGALAWGLQQGRPLVAGLLGLGLLALTLSWSLPQLHVHSAALPKPSATLAASALNPTEHSARQLGNWLPWSAEVQAQTLAQGQPVFVDFTAAWCVTCQYNKKTTLSDTAVLTAFAQKNVRLLRADWTRQDPAISAALQALGRSGVPVYVLHVPGQAPEVFTEILWANALQAALQPLPSTP